MEGMVLDASTREGDIIYLGTRNKDYFEIEHEQIRNFKIIARDLAGNELINYNKVENTWVFQFENKIQRPINIVEIHDPTKLDLNGDPKEGYVADLFNIEIIKTETLLEYPNGDKLTLLIVQDGDMIKSIWTRDYD